MPRIPDSVKPIFGIARRPAENKRRRGGIHRPCLEVLEGRIALSSVAQNDAYDPSFLHPLAYQPLNGDSNYDISGTIRTSTDPNDPVFAHVYGFYEKAGDLFTVSGDLAGEPSYGFGVFAPGDKPLYSNPHVIGPTFRQFAAPSSGVYLMLIGINPTKGVVKTGFYNIRVAGTELPKIKVDPPPGNPVDSTTFLITTDPDMPTIKANLVGVAPDPLFKVEYDWGKKINYHSSDYPAKPGRGPGPPKDQTTIYLPQKIEGSLDFTADFKDAAGNPVIRGGTLILSVNATIAGIPIQAMTPAKGAGKLSVIGKNPTPKEVHDYVNSLSAPAGWPAHYSFDFHATLRKILSQESSGGSGAVKQFVEGVPKWSSDGRFGAGLGQMTPASIDEAWNWHTNVKDAAIKLRSSLERAEDFFDGTFDRNEKELNALKVKLGLSQIVIGTVTDQMIAQDAIRGYNGFSAGLHEYRTERRPDGRFALSINGTIGTTIWERTPPSARVDKKGNPIHDQFYVNHVEEANDF